MECVLNRDEEEVTSVYPRWGLQGYLSIFDLFKVDRLSPI